MMNDFTHAYPYPAYPGAFIAQVVVSQPHLGYPDFSLFVPCPCPDCTPHYYKRFPEMPFTKAQEVQVQEFGGGYVFQEGLDSSSVYLPQHGMILTVPNSSIRSV